jgi:aminopeptidase
VLRADRLYNTAVMRDARIDEYARLLIDRSIDVQPGWQVFVQSTPLARPLVDAVQEQIARRGAYPILQLVWQTVATPFAREAPLELLARPAPIQLRIWEECDAFIMIKAPENTREGSDLSEERRRLLQQRVEPLRRRQMAMEVPWVVCEYPTDAAAQEAGMNLDEYTEFVFGAVLLDWDAEGERMACIARLFDRAQEVRILAEGTDLTLSLAGRRGAIDDGHINMPGGEVFYSPVEDAVDGEVTFSEFPGVYYGHEVSGARFVFEQGRIVEASAASGQDFLLQTLDSDEGARRLGELGIGCNPRIQRYTKNVGFDEKIDGTVHLAIGNSYSATGGTNTSSVHWDMVKDLRNGGRLYADGRLVQEDGRWLELDPPEPG